jgi:hypothetical protein
LKSKIRHDPITFFLLRFAFIFGLLIFPWPGWNETYGQYFRVIGEAAFTRDEGRRAVVFSPGDAAAVASGLDTGITLGNRGLDTGGKSLVRKSSLDTRSIGWVPTALTIALIAATPIPVRRRFWAILGGLVLVHAFILFSLQAWIWNNSTDVSLLSLSPFWKKVAGDLDYTLIDQLGASFSIPVLIWILVTFGRQDAVVKKAFPGGKQPRGSGR